MEWDPSVESVACLDRGTVRAAFVGDVGAPAAADRSICGATKRRRCCHLAGRRTSGYHPVERRSGLRHSPGPEIRQGAPARHGGARALADHLVSLRLEYPRPLRPSRIGARADGGVYDVQARRCGSGRQESQGARPGCGCGPGPVPGPRPAVEHRHSEHRTDRGRRGPRCGTTKLGGGRRADLRQDWHQRTAGRL